MRIFPSPFPVALLAACIAGAAGARLTLAQPIEPRDLDALRPAAGELVSSATHSPLAFRRLAELCDRFGPRFAGSTNLELALGWCIQTMRADGLENVHSEPVAVPHWVRGTEALDIITPRPQRCAVTAFGPSVSTGPGGITAEVLVVSDFDELRRRSVQARGKIVLFNRPFTTYGETRVVRTKGAVEAAKAGAVASLVRSLTPAATQLLHTGMMRYEDGTPAIPHGAISVEDALLMQRMQDRGDKIRVHLRLESQRLPDRMSQNVVAEWRGREHPEQVVVIGGHSDSWDLGPGAHDDAGGCVAAWEAVRLISTLRQRPRRTVRLVFWVNEEMGLNGAKAYALAHAAELPRHIAAIEADLGVFAPTGFSMGGNEAGREWLRNVTTLVPFPEAKAVLAGGGGADTSPLAERGVPAMELLTKPERYFWYHHTGADTVDKVDPAELNQCVAALAVVTYGIAELPRPLPR